MNGKPASASGRYLKYAIGEIFLVMIGILLALTINNWNEGRKQNQRTEAILLQIIDELKIDLQTLQSLNTGYTRKDSLINLYKASDFTNPKAENLDSAALRDLIRTYMPFTIHDRGFQLLTSHTDELDPSYAEDMENLIIIYQDVVQQMDIYFDGMMNILEEHKRYLYENFDWYGGGAFRQTSDEEYLYYMHHPRFKNYMKVYIEMYVNIMINSRWFIDLATKVIVQIEAKLEKQVTNDLIKIPPTALLENLSGSYAFKEKSSPLTLEVKDNKLYDVTNKGQTYFGEAFDSQYIPGELRYLGDSTFYLNVLSNLKINADGTVTILELFFNRENLTSISKD